jgi:hypothetical protein
VSDDRTLPAVTFSNFVISLAQSAMVHLGEAPDPATGRKLAPQLPVARHTIDVLGVLADKTKGNLDDEEQKLIDSVLFECRSKFVAASQASEAAPQA